MSAAPEAAALADDAGRELAMRIFDGVAALSPDREGVSRPAFSDKETEILEHLAALAVDEGLSIGWDAGSNLWIALPEDADAPGASVVGSHVDSVPMGGNFDGLAGVAAGLVCLIRARRAGRRFARPVQVLAMRGEESAWFGPCYNASKALTGVLSAAEIDSPHKGDGRPMGAHMADIGIDMDRVRAGEPLLPEGRMRDYLELHIEQGPLLIEKGLSVAAVSAIRGNFRHRAVRCIGEAGHSGAVPRAYRHDPVLAMADLLSRLDESWLAILQQGGDLVLTAGMVNTDPERSAMSRIADEVTFSLDVRSQDTEVLDNMRTLLRDEIAEVERARGVRFELGDEVAVAPGAMAADRVSALQDAMSGLGLDPFVMPSGGGHDAAIFAQSGIPSAMLFVRNRNGSHNPNEAMEIDDFLVAVAVIDAYLSKGAP
ncbi:Zn-dependent hydrolase [Tranquillimonas rosea]|uniref:Zn-dependent hydrolase n=1 Tax=Tranquillimonas rosea TaxID=641238 RepID=UPI003BAC07CE